MLQGLMQNWQLTVDRILQHAATCHGEREVVSRSPQGPVVRTTYGQVYDRARRLSNALLSLGIKPGDRVATLAWNSARHLETWYAVMGIGAVCHTLNPRLFTDQLCYIIRHAEDRVIFTDASLLPPLLQHWKQLPHVEHLVVLGDENDAAPFNTKGGIHRRDAGQLKEFDGAAPNPSAILSSESLIAAQSPDVTWGNFDEQAAAGLCYTSGTTGNPKGVLYSHRSNFLHTLMSLGTDTIGLSARDVVLMVVPMFHANSWGIGFSAPAAGAKLVMPGAHLDGASVHELLETESVTISAAVPTVWQMLLNHLTATGGKLTTLNRAVIGGAAVPESMVRAFRDEYGVNIIHAWGMTEISPIGTVGTPTARIAEMDAEARLRYTLKQGRPPLGIELQVTDESGRPLPRDGSSCGHLKVRGPWVAREYFKGEGGELLDGQGFLDTGDIATVDEHALVHITDRAKDVIKSGGEWISSIAVENVATGHPKVARAAVIGVAHPTWGERPLLVAELKPGVTAEARELLAYLEGRMARWWIPDEVIFVERIPLGPTGKVDKKVIRQQLAERRR